MAVTYSNLTMSFLSKCRCSNFLKISKHFVKNFSEFAETLPLQDDPSSKNFEHIYNPLFTRDEIVQKVADSVVYNKDNMVVVNKPNGLNFKKIIEKDPASLDTLPRPTIYYSLKEILPDLATKLGVDSLHLTNTCERSSSGVIILPTSKSKTENIQKFLLKNKGSVVEKFFVISVGQPNVPSLKKNFGLKSTKLQKKIFHVTDKNEFDWEHKVLSTSKYASLVEVVTSRVHHNFIGLVMATKLFSPILGDHLHGNRVRKVMGVYLPVDPRLIPNRKTPQHLDKDLMKALQLTPSMVSIMPKQAHLYSVVLRNFSDVDLFVSAPPPESFRWTCERLELDTNGIF